MPFGNTECTNLNDVEHRNSSVPVLSCDTVRHFPIRFDSVSKALIGVSHHDSKYLLFVENQ